MTNKQLSDLVIYAIFIFAVIFTCLASILFYVALIMFPKYCMVAVVTFLVTIGAGWLINKSKNDDD